MKLFYIGSAVLILSVFAVLLFESPGTIADPGPLIRSHKELQNDCYKCHTILSGVENEKCVSCHKIDEIGIHKSNSGKNIKFHNSLAPVKCSACHTDHGGLDSKGTLSSFSHDLLPGAVVNNCAECHMKPGDKIHTALAGNCNGCHKTGGWKPASFDHKLLVGADLNNCASCHKEPNDNLHRASGSDCKACHSADKWKPSTFDHNKYFVFDKDHPNTCTDCHAQDNYKQYTCYNCHEHSPAKIESEHLEEGITDFKNCVSCHRSGDKEDNEHHGKDKKKKDRERESDDD